MPSQTATILVTDLVGSTELRARLGGAMAHHEAAAATIEACGAARARALNGYQWALTFLARDAPGDRRRAAELLEETLAYCRAKNYATFVDKAEQALAETTGAD